MSVKDHNVLVEGYDDLFVVTNLLEHYSVPQVFSVEQFGGVDPLIESFEVRLKAGHTVAIVFDADTDPRMRQRWGAVMEALGRQGYTSLPVSPLPNGTLIKQPGRSNVGIWVMPDNSYPGILEDFAARLVPNGDELWRMARDAVDKVPSSPARFETKDTAKARMHTWLAWQRQPGLPLGTAIKLKYLNPSVPEAAVFIAWVRSVFSL